MIVSGAVFSSIFNSKIDHFKAADQFRSCKVSNSLDPGSKPQVILQLESVAHAEMNIRVYGPESRELFTSPLKDDSVLPTVIGLNICTDSLTDLAVME